ncbi:sulfate transporter family protein [Lutibaculum baratangense]|uniref:Putative membrane protein n=1 Tax=Lutibaculum baratangense AMV1 TaxID=631454 RepID=V4RJ29_9HYPH|nr:sulfate transporter family protein [Lutibaculum baratangense]ESR26091.1 putative membrane protein [Lutibaculum baratangense AMV1]
MLKDALDAFRDVFSRPFRATLLKTLGLTVAVLAGLGVGLYLLFAHFVALPWGWAEWSLDIVAALGLLIALAFLVAPASTVVAGLFLDDIAARVERQAFPAIGEGTGVPFVRSVVLSLRFFAVTLAANLAALVLLLVPGVNLVIFLLVNAYLLGREYFELAAMRYRPPEEARSVRRVNGGRVFAAGLLVAGYVSIPLLNLTTPLFATSFLVRYHRRLAGEREALPSAQPVLSG